MSLLAYVFPGQGAQYAGMGTELITRFASARRVFQLSGDLLRMDMEKLCREGGLEQLSRTEMAQPAILTFGYASFLAFLEETGLFPDLMAGHSLGEITALTCAGAIRFEDALLLVRQRGRLMQEAVPPGEGGMAAVIGVPREQIERWCQSLAAETGMISPSNYNTPVQTVVSGTTEAVRRLSRLAEEQGGRAVSLQVSAPFHSPLMEQASILFGQELLRYRYREPRCKVLSNVTGKPYGEDDIPRLLRRQIVCPVDWIACTNYMAEGGVTDVVEFGPGKVVGKLVSANMPLVRILTAGELEELETLKTELSLATGRSARPLGTAFVSRCLAIAAATQNHNPDAREYREEALPQYRKLEDIMDAIQREERRPTEEEQLAAASALERIMMVKRTPQSEWLLRKRQLSLLAGDIERLKFHYIDS